MSGDRIGTAGVGAAGVGAAGVGAAEIGAALASLRAAVDTLLDVDFEALDEGGFPGVIDAFECERRRLEAVDVRLLAATEHTHVAARHCRSSTAELLVHRLRLSPGEARARVRRACDLGPRSTLHGEPLEPIHPVLAAAQQAGEMSAQQLDVATRVLGRIPVDIAYEATPVAEALFAEAARHQNPVELARTGTMLLARLDPDGSEPNDERAYARREVRLHRRPDGSWTICGELTDETGLALRTVLNPLAAPAPAADGEPDTRTTAQREHDALLELCARILRSGTLPDAGGVAVTILARVDAAELGDPDATAQTELGDLIRLSTLRRLAGDAELIPVLFDRAASDCQLYLGRTRRLASPAQRRVLAARDGGCSFPGCTRPSSWTEVHHILEWLADDGLTDIDNLTLLCGYHHREFGRRGWRVQMSEGLPHWIPPYWLDPEQKPRANTAHHVPDIVFESDGTVTARPIAGRDLAPPLVPRPVVAEPVVAEPVDNRDLRERRRQ